MKQLGLFLVNSLLRVYFMRQKMINIYFTYIILNYIKFSHFIIKIS